jgi:hypothetical protein
MRSPRLSHRRAILTLLVNTRSGYDPQAADGVVEGLGQVLAALPITQPLARVLWFMTPKTQLQERAPIDVLKDGDVDRVVAEAQAVYAR